MKTLHCMHKPSGVEGNTFSARQDGVGLLMPCVVPDVPAHTRGSARMLAHRGSMRVVRDGMVLALSSSRAKNRLSQHKGISHATETPAPVRFGLLLFLGMASLALPLPAHAGVR